MQQVDSKLLEILDLGPDDTFLSTGDLSSKGEDSRGVHCQLLSLQQRGVNVIVLLGNHELMNLQVRQPFQLYSRSRCCDCTIASCYLSVHCLAWYCSALSVQH